MAARSGAENLESLTRDQLWQAHMPINTLSVDVFEAEDQPVGVLTAYGSERYTKEPTLTTPFTGNDRYRWLAHAVFREGGAFRSDVEYGEIASCVMQGEVRATRLRDAELADALLTVRAYTVMKMLQRTRSNIKQMNRFIQKQGDIHIGYGRAGVPEFHVARLVKVAASPADDKGRRKPIAVIEGKGGAIGTKPIDRRVRREIFVGRIGD